MHKLCRPKSIKDGWPRPWSPVQQRQSSLASAVSVPPPDVPRPVTPKFITRIIPAGLGIGAFFSLMSASFAYEDPLLRQSTQAGMNNTQKAREIFKEMGRGMWKTGKGFGKVGALFAGIECVIEGVRPVSLFLQL